MNFSAVLEFWSIGVMDPKNNGIMECWNMGLKETGKNLEGQLFHYSIIPYWVV
jgi:hypothetical protein